MRRSAVWFFLALLLIAALIGCGGGSGSATGPPATITASPSSLSLETGTVAGISVTLTDSKGNTVSSTSPITFASSNPSVATVSSAGAVCAGTWDAKNIVCTPGTAGTANVTVTSGTLTATVPVFAHAHVDRLVVSPASVNCKSQGQTQQMTAQALSNGLDITSTVGPITWSSTRTSVATVDSNGLVTAVAPGGGSISASAASTNSLPAVFITCPVQTVHIHLPSAPDTSFSFAVGATQQIQLDAVDSAGQAVTVTPTWASSQPVVAGVSSTGLATAAQPGTTTITASCSGSACNIGLLPVYSNTVVASVPGTSANVVFAAGTGSTSLIPIDTTANTAGTAITLPAQPNSLLVNGAGTTVFLGSSAGLMTVTTSSNAVANDASHPGTVLAISPNGTWVVVALASSVTLVNTATSSSSQALSIAGATSAAFTPDSAKLFITAGNVLWSVIPGSTATSTVEATVVRGASTLSSGGFAYFGSDGGNSALAIASCSSAIADTVLTPGSPTLTKSLPNDAAVLAVDSPFIDVITPATTLAGCPPPLTDTVVSKDFLQGAFTARQLIVQPDGTKAYVTSNLGALLVYDVTNGNVLPALPLAGSANAFTGGSTLDSKSVYVGGSDNAVHRIDTTAGADVQQIPLSFTPDLVAVRPK